MSDAQVASSDDKNAATHSRNELRSTACTAWGHGSSVSSAYRSAVGPQGGNVHHTARRERGAANGSRNVCAQADSLGLQHGVDT